MRTMTIVVGVFLLLVGIALGSNKFINNSSQHLMNHLDAVQASIVSENWDNAQKELSLTSTAWQQAKPWWTVLIDHHEIDNIDLSISRLEQYVAAKSTALSLGELAALLLLVEHISTQQMLTLENIL